MSHHTKDKGDLGVLKVQADLATQGFTILHPLTEHAPFDLVVYKNRKFLRIQVKYRCLDNGAVWTKMRNAWNDKNGTHYLDMDKKEVDVLAFYCPDTDECYYVAPKDFNRTITLRVKEMGGGRKNDKTVHWAKNFQRLAS